MRLSIVFIILFHVSLSLAYYDDVTIVNSSYRGVVIAINPAIAENITLLNAIKAAWTEASAALFVATKKRVYFGEITILVPKTWNGSYGKAITEKYNKADVLVVKPTRGNNEPQTLNTGQCGDHGLHISLTTDYLTESEFLEDWGPRGKTIVHEWAHLRWGVFDETAQPGGEKFYFDGKGKIKATKCPAALDGEFLEINHKTGRVKDCTYDNVTNLPNQDCSFFPYDTEQPEDLSTSLMSQQYMENVNFFCHDDPNDPVNRHNKEAPNAQNRMCRKQSTWSVIMNSSDFANNLNPPNANLMNTTPVFKLVKPHPFRRYVLVLDISVSMAGERLTKMLQTVRIFIEDFVSDGNHVGIVTFASFARTKSELQLVHTKSDRDYLANLLPESVRGSTCIGCGINEAIAVFENRNENLCGDIVVFTDGDETRRPYVKEVMEKVKKKKCTMNSIFFTTNGNSDLQNLVQETKGTWFFSNDIDITSLINAFGKLASSQDGDLTKQTTTVTSKHLVFNAQQTIDEDVIIDSTIGKDTVFKFLWSKGDAPLVVTITGPGGCRHSTDQSMNKNMCEGHPLAVIEDKIKIVRFKIPGIAEKGKWRYEITSHVAQSITVTLTSKTRDENVKPIIVQGGLTKTEIKKLVGAVAYARVTQGGLPVVGATVKMKIGRPDGTNVEIRLFDKGDVPDQKANDGTYSKYFTGYTTQGRYSVSISATGANGSAVNQTSVGLNAAFRVGYIKKDGEVVLNKNGDKNQPKPIEDEVEEIGDFSRVVAGDSFSFSGLVVAEDVDVYAPNKIGDLKVKQANINNPDDGVILSFTAPGDDLDSGTADYYTIAYHIVSNGSTTQVTSEDIITGNLTAPLEHGSKETFLLKTPNITQKSGVVKIAYTVYATDENNNNGEPSFEEILNLYFKPPDRPTLPPTIRVETTTSKTTTRPTKKPSRHSKLEEKKWCRNSYRRAYRVAYGAACARYNNEAYVAACYAARQQYYWTRENFHFECEKLDYSTACIKAYYEACNNYYCTTCYSHFYRASYSLYTS